MEKHLKRGQVLFDIGVSDGWVSAIYAKFVGPENMCLFEPSSAAWANIKADWDANHLKLPKRTFWGFVGDTTQLVPTELMAGESLEHKNGWPLSAYNANLQEEATFRSLLSTGRNIPQTTIDDYVLRTFIVPDALSIDVEGAELLVLRGAKKTLDLNHPLIWLSLHDLNGALTYDYRTTKDEVFQFLTEHGYKMTWLEDYGDSHWLCQ
jgi:FkbM family methyltransferase